MSIDKYYFVIYDITDDKQRMLLYRYLKYIGLTHIQKSGFKGRLSERDIKELHKFIKEIDLEKKDKIHIIFICSSCQDKIVLYGTDPEPQEHLIF